MSLSLKSLKSKSMKLMNNDLLTNLVIFITLALLVSYLSKQQYEAVIILLLIGGLVFLIGKNLLYSLIIAIILTNLLISSRVLKLRRKEGFKEGQTNEQTENNDSDTQVDKLANFKTITKNTKLFEANEKCTEDNPSSSDNAMYKTFCDEVKNRNIKSLNKKIKNVGDLQSKLHLSNQ